MSVMTANEWFKKFEALTTVERTVTKSVPVNGASKTKCLFYTADFLVSCYCDFQEHLRAAHALGIHIEIMEQTTVGRIEMLVTWTNM